jgi:hypothetical protein
VLRKKKGGSGTPVHRELKNTLYNKDFVLKCGK